MASATKTVKAGTIEAPPTLGEMRNFRVRFVGITPLLQNNAATADISTDTNGDDLKKTKKKHLSGDAEAESKTYRTEAGQFYHPAEAFRSAAIDAVTGMKIGKTSAPALFMSGLFVIHEQAILLDPSTNKPLKQYKTDTRNIINPNTGGMMPRSRPLWEEWACEVEFEYDVNDLNEDIILNALKLAGVKIGIGELRPTPRKKNSKKGKGGRYGKFRPERITSKKMD